MYSHFFSFFGLREDPFHVSPDPRFYYPTRAQEAALAELLFGIESRKGFMVLSGEAGTGKTTLLNQLLDWLQRHNRSTAYVFHALLDPVELLQFILRDFGIPCSSHHKGHLVSALHDWLLARNSAGDLPVLIIDEAQALPQQTLDELRLLLNLETPRGKLLQIILSGQPELDEKLRLPTLRQLRQRIIFHSRLPLLAPGETASYISCRLAAAGCGDSSLFPTDAVQAIYASSRGIPRVVNLLCEHALIAAFAEQQHVISPEIIQRIAMDFDLLAKPLAVTDAEAQPHFARIASAFAVADFPLRPPVASEPAPTAVPIPAAARPAAAPVQPIQPIRSAEPPEPIQPLEPLPAATYNAASTEFQGIPKYWRKHRSRSAIAVFARNSAESIQHTGRELSATLLRAWQSLRAPKPPVSDAPPLRAMAIPRPDQPITVPRPARPARHPLICYFKSVLLSFLYDCRLFFRALSMPSPALELGTSAAAATGKPPMRRRRNVLVPIANWLRQPISTGPLSPQRRSTRTAARK